MLFIIIADIKSFFNTFYAEEAAYKQTLSVAALFDLQRAVIWGTNTI